MISYIVFIVLTFAAEKCRAQTTPHPEPVDWVLILMAFVGVPLAFLLVVKCFLRF